MDLKFSVITASFNSRATIENTIQSVLDQHYKNTEYIVIDGHSSDGTQQIIESFLDGIDYFVSEKDTGVYNAMNKGLKAATGDIVFFLNSDDIFADDYVLQDISEIFNTSPDLELVFGNQIFKSGNTLVHKNQDFRISRKQLARMTIQHQTIFARRSLFGQTHNFSEEYKIVSDYDWILKTFLEIGVSYLYVNRDISIMDTGGLSWSVDFEEERRRVMKNYFTSFEIYWYRTVPQLMKKISQKIKKGFQSLESGLSSL